MFLIESRLTVVALVVAVAFPKAGSRWFEVCERAFLRLAQKRRLAVLVVGLTALAARAALLPILPIPEPGGHDDFAYLLLADTFAHGRLTNPTHPMWVHFESFHIIWQPTYTAMFYPAQGLIVAFGQVAFGRPFWGVWLSVGLMCAAICWMLQGWLPPGWALLGGFLAIIRLGTFSYWANSYFGGAVTATGGALVLGALPRIKRSQRVRDALMMGLGFAIVATSRPYEGLFLGMPVAGALSVWMFSKRQNPLLGNGGIKGLWNRVVAPLLLVLVLTACAMGCYFWRTTGDFWEPPHSLVAHTYSPVPYFPWQALRPTPVYRHAVMRDYYLGPMMERYKATRSITGTLGTCLIALGTLWEFYLGPVLTLPLLAVLVALPYGFSWRDISSSTRFLFLVCGLSIVGSVLPIFYLPHYTAAITSAMLTVVVSAIRRVRSLHWRGRWTGLFIARAVPLICLVMLALRAGVRPLHLPETGRWLVDVGPSWCTLGPANLERAATLAELQKHPGRQLAIVRYGPHHDILYHEWVYNEADIDRAKVVWARDMGAAGNRELIDYFKDRHIWLVDADENPPGLSPYPASADRYHPRPTKEHDEGN